MLPTGSMADPYPVYSAVIAELYLTDEVQQFVILQQSENGVSSGGSAEELRPFLQQSFGGALAGDTLANYLDQSARRVLLAQKFTLSHDYVFIDQEMVDNLVGESGDWKRFFDAYPGASGVIGLSAVGFNQAQDQALVYTTFVGDYGSGQGYYVLLTKQDGAWRVEQTVIAWVS